MEGDLLVAARVGCTTAEGPFERYALWVAGCHLRCAGCCNPDMFAGNVGNPMSIDAITEEMRSQPIEGITLLGGEPLEQLEPVAGLARAAAMLGLGVIVFTGYTLAESRRRGGFGELWATIDTLVDGRYDARQREPPPSAGGRRFIGSRNQRLHHRTARYAEPSLWRGPNRAEVRISANGTVTVHGFPALVSTLRRGLS